MQIPHTGIVRPAFVMLAGETLTQEADLLITAFSELYLRFGAAHPDISADGASLVVELLDADGGCLTLAEHFVPSGSSGLAPRALRLELHPYAGKRSRLRLRCGAGTRADPHGDWVAIYDLALASSDRLSNVRARAFRAERSTNELVHFEDVYDHAIYRPADSAETNTAATYGRSADCESLADLLARVSPSREADGPPAVQRLKAPEELQPRPDTAYVYADRLLQESLRMESPDFATSLRALAGGRRLKVLSLCCGAARIEAEFAGIAIKHGVEVDWTLLDMNGKLLRTAAAKFGDRTPRLVVGDINQVEDFGERFDVVMCVSALHHVVELERVLEFVSESLRPAGEFWSIGEAIGRNGNRLWEADYLVANAFFEQLPARLRANRGTGAVDECLPNVHCADASFEGIRSQEILPLLARQFEAVHTYLYNCFLWRLTNQAYSDNYDLSQSKDIQYLQDAVIAELQHFEQGGCPASLHGIFRKRQGR